jgi:hypothetical protein
MNTIVQVLHDLEASKTCYFIYKPADEVDKFRPGDLSFPFLTGWPLLFFFISRGKIIEGYYPLLPELVVFLSDVQ